jgi:hypothetical protein
MERLASVQQYMCQSEAYKEVFPNIIPDLDRGWNRHRLFLKRDTLAKDPSLHALGVLSTKAVGGRSDMNIYDDLNDLKNTVLDVKTRSKIYHMYTTQLHPRIESHVEEDGFVSGHKGAGICTRFHAQDVYGLITREPDMLTQYGFLIQSISDDLQSLDCEILIGKPVDGLDRPRPLKRKKLDVLLEQYELGLFHDV